MFSVETSIIIYNCFSFNFYNSKHDLFFAVLKPHINNKFTYYDNQQPQILIYLYIFDLIPFHVPTLFECCYSLLSTLLSHSHVLSNIPALIGNSGYNNINTNKWENLLTKCFCLFFWNYPLEGVESTRGTRWAGRKKGKRGPLT